MLTRSRLVGWIVGLLVLAVPLAVGAQSSPSGSADSGKQQVERGVSQPGNNAPVWRDVRSGQNNYTTAKGPEAGVLVQSSGETWRRIRNGPLTFYGGWLVVIVCLVIGAIYFSGGPIKLHAKPTGRLIERFSSVDRWAHWVMGISFVVLGVTGLITMFGKYVLLPVIGYTLFSWLSLAGKYLHNFVAPLFIVSLLVFIVIYLKDNLLKGYDFAWFGKVFGFFFRGEHIPSGRFNAGEKVWFWIGVVLLSLVVSASGLVLLFPNLDQLRETMQLAHVIHVIAGLLVLVAAIGHIYMGTIGVDGAYEAMRSGTVDETWAKEHHEYWYHEAKLGGKQTTPGGAVPAGAARARRDE